MSSSRENLFPAVVKFLEERQTEFDQISEERQTQLRDLGDYVRSQTASDAIAKLTFICTHNSRRSHLGQIWAKIAADFVGLPNVQTFSGGTEATAMNERVVASLKRTGLLIESSDSSAENPRFEIRYAENCDSLECFSKVYDHQPNPTTNFCAIMTCSSADEACPIVPGCDLRLPIRYVDPKVADDTSQEAETYDERSRQTCREMLFAMNVAVNRNP